MYPILIVAVGLLQLTSAAFVPSPGASLAERAATGKSMFRSNKPPRLFRQTDPESGRLNETFTFEQKELADGGGHTRDAPGVVYSLSNDARDVKVQLVRPARKKLPSDKKGFVVGEKKGTVHDVIGQLKPIDLDSFGNKTIIAVEELQTGGVLQDGKYHVAITGTSVPPNKRSPASGPGTERWISPLFQVKKGPNHLSTVFVPPTAPSSTTNPVKTPASACQCTCDPKQGLTTAR